MKINLYARVLFFVLLSVVMIATAFAFGDDSRFVLAATSILPVISARRNTRTRLVATIQPTAFPSITRIPIPRDFVYSKFLLRLTGSVTVAGGAGDGALVAEQPWSLLRSVRIEASSPSRPNVAEIRAGDFAALGVFNRFFAGTPPVAAVLAIPGIQAATPISAQCDIPFYIPRCGRLRDPFSNLLTAAINCHELASLDLVVEWGAGQGDMIFGGDRVITLNNIQLQVEAEEYLDDLSNVGRYAVNISRMIEFSSIAATTNFPVDLKRGFITRGVLIKQFTRPAGQTDHTPVNTVINAVSVMVNGIPKIQYASTGVAASGWLMLQAENRTVFGLEASPAGYAFLDFMSDGMLDRLSLGSDYTSIGLNLDINTIANSVMRVYPVEIVDRNQ